ncbi:tetratricopeptide repeat protein [Bacillus sp. REN10]|uniref:tetratricopeptide repeat protein n=1 Tax=Bacillus sp. REN10 TaxID=2782541 RepID=UPI00193B605D|nr:tetratricopeptide repeat protein [Bacillus sp. REN10]
MAETAAVSLEVIEHYFDIGRYQQVIDLVKEEMDQHLENGRIWYILGYSHYVLNHYEEAEGHLIEAIRLGYEPEMALYILAHVYMETERWVESEKAFLESLRLHPNNASIHAGYATLMKKTGHHKKAKALIEKALELDPEDPQALRSHYLLEGRNGNREQQVLLLERYMQSADSDLAKVIHLGLDAIFRNRVKEAKDYFRQAYLMNPHDQELLELLEDLELASHPLYAPNRLIERVGGPGMFWLIGIGLTFLLSALGFTTASVICLFIYVTIAISSWLTEPLIKIIRKVRGR